MLLVSIYQGLQGGHDAEGDCRDNSLELAHLAEKAEQAEGPQDPQLLDPAVGSAAKAFILAEPYSVDERSRMNWIYCCGMD